MFRAIGTLVGLLAGYFGGLLDDAFMRIADIQLSFPTILMALAIMAVLGSGLDKLILVLGLTGWVAYGRIVRGQVMSLRHEEFVLAARATGERQWRIIFQHILPNIWSPVIVIASFMVASNIVAEASLSFLGVGVPPEVPSWGGMLAHGRQYVGVAAWLTIPSGIAISATDLSINLLGDWLRHSWVDPKFEEMFKAFNEEFDQSKWTDMCNEAQAYVAEQAPVVWMFAEPALYGVSQRLDYEARPDGRMYLNMVLKGVSE